MERCPGFFFDSLSSRTRMGTVERANAIATATLPAEAQRRLTVIAVESRPATAGRTDNGHRAARSLGSCTNSTLVSRHTSTLQIHMIGASAPTSSWCQLAPLQTDRERAVARAPEGERCRRPRACCLQPRGEGELIELSDDEAVAAAVMLPMVAADRLAPSASEPHRRRVEAKCPGRDLRGAPSTLFYLAAPQRRRRHFARLRTTWRDGASRPGAAGGSRLGRARRCGSKQISASRGRERRRRWPNAEPEALAPTVCHRLASTLATFGLLR